MIQAENLNLFLGGRNIFNQTGFTIFPGEKVGVVGANGAGKSTLFALITGRLTPDGGVCKIPSAWRIAHINQALPQGDMTPLDYVLEGDHEYHLVNQKLLQAERLEDYMTVAQAHDELHVMDGYRVPAKAAHLLKGLGFSDAQMSQAIDSFSGGWKMRLNLARTLMSRAELFLLDEPTNHLDLDAIIWLEEWVKQASCTVLVITHDAAFLDAVPERILLVDKGQFTLNSGNYSDYLRHKASQLAQQQAQFNKQQKIRSHLQSFVDRFRAKASKAKQAQSRLKALERLPDIAAVQEESAFKFEFQTVTECPNPVIRLEKVDFAYPGCAPNFVNLNLLINPGDRIALLGLNGAGKSTLMKLLSGAHEPSSGIRQMGNGLKIGYFAQEQAEAFPVDDSPLTWFQRQVPQSHQREVRGFLGRFAFSEDKALQMIGSLSGGERARLALAWIVWLKPHLLLLDEPTNHLDLDMRQALTLALQTFTGAVVLVSHDRQLIVNTADELWWVHEGVVEHFAGDMDAYSRRLKEERRDALKKNNEVPSRAQKKENKTQRLQKVEKELQSLQTKLTRLETKLQADDTQSHTSQRTIAERTELLEKIQVLEVEWLDLSE